MSDMDLPRIILDQRQELIGVFAHQKKGRPFGLPLRYGEILLQACPPKAG
jgi:hypothetical protein